MRSLPLRAGATIGLVPTMGALHAGHRALLRGRPRRVRRRRREPVRQPGAVLATRATSPPTRRASSADERSAADAGVDFLFAPAVEEFYPAGFATWVEPEGAAVGLEGEARPGHFRGVATACLKLFTIVRPDVAYFGRKDAQQVAVVKQLVRDLNLELEIRIVPTVRDADGLALSSRNGRLSDDERRRALAIPRALATRDPERARGAPRRGRDRARLRRRRRPRRPDARRRRPRRLHPPDRQRAAGRRRSMSTRPRHPGPSPPAPGKLALPELARDEAPRRPHLDGHRLRRARPPAWRTRRASSSSSSATRRRW